MIYFYLYFPALIATCMHCMCVWFKFLTCYVTHSMRLPANTASQSKDSTLTHMIQNLLLGSHLHIFFLTLQTSLSLCWYVSMFNWASYSINPIFIAILFILSALNPIATVKLQTSIKCEAVIWLNTLLYIFVQSTRTLLLRTASFSSPICPPSYASHWTNIPIIDSTTKCSFSPWTPKIVIFFILKY